MSTEPDIFLWQLTMIFSVTSIALSSALLLASVLYFYHARRHFRKVLRGGPGIPRDRNGRPLFERD